MPGAADPRALSPEAEPCVLNANSLQPLGFPKGGDLAGSHFPGNVRARHQQGVSRAPEFK